MHSNRESQIENQGLLDFENEADEKHINTTHPNKWSKWLWLMVYARDTLDNISSILTPRSSVKSIRLLVTTAILAIFAYVTSQATDLSSTSFLKNTKPSPFSGAFARFPNTSALPPRHQRITLLAFWNNDSWPSYLRHFFYTAGLNKDHVDLVLINRKLTPDAECLDLEKQGVAITSNIHVHCMENEEFKRRHVDFLCSQEHGWNCSQQEYDEVTESFRPRPDLLNVNFRPLHGYMFRDLFLNQDNPFWAWTDMDAFLGDFARYPFNALSQLSFVTGGLTEYSFVYMAGQFTAFNLDDINLATAWKQMPVFRTANHFTKELEGGLSYKVKEERYWSWGYTRSNENLPGTNLSYMLYPEFQGDDFFAGSWVPQNATQSYAISGKDIFLIPSSLDREQIEHLIKMERAKPFTCDLGGMGWTTGEDGSAYLVDQPSLTSEEARNLAMNQALRPSSKPVSMHSGYVEDVYLNTLTCRKDQNPEVQCVLPNQLTTSEEHLMRGFLIRFKEQQPMHLLRRLEWDARPKGYQRRMLKHHSRVKKMDWFEFPPWDVTNDHVLRHNANSIEVWKMGSDRSDTLFYRSKGEESIG